MRCNGFDSDNYRYFSLNKMDLDDILVRYCGFHKNKFSS